MIYDNIAVLRNMACKLAEAFLNILNAGEEVKVILLNIEYSMRKIQETLPTYLFEENNKKIRDRD